MSRFTSAPQRTTEYRVSRLLHRRLVGRIRPARPTGSAPWHWWLTPAGAKLINGVACAADRRAPNPLFLAHTTAIAEVLLALTEAGPAAGLAVDRWWPDAAGWAQWRQGSGPGGRLRRITPDATVHLRLTPPTPAQVADDGDGGSARLAHDGQQAAGGDGRCGGAGQPEPVTGLGAALVEVDLATMTTERLRAKLHRYLDYAQDLAWQTSQPSQPHAPLLLVLTTSDARARNFLAGAARTLPKPGEVWGPAYEAELRAAARLHVAACGQVRDPLVAVTGRVWRRPGDPNPVTLRELLEERIALQKRAEQIRAHVRERERRVAFENQLSQISRRPLPARMLPADPRAAAVLRALHADGRQALAEWAGRQPEPARQLLERWYDVNDADRVSDAGAVGAVSEAERPQELPMEPELLAALAGEFEPRWTEQARTLLAADGPIAIGAPKWRAAAHVLLTGQLTPTFDLQQAALSWETPVAAQERLWRAREPGRPDFPQRADAAATDQWWALSLLGRRRTAISQLRADYDAQHLLVCAGCGLSTDRGDLEASCRACGYPTHASESADTGALLTAPEQVVALKAELR